jgi:hypothetical protein
MVDSVRATLPPEMGDEMFTSIMSDAGHSTPKSLRVSTRMWWVTPPPDGSDTGLYAQDAIDLFEAGLKGYIGEN